MTTTKLERIDAEMQKTREKIAEYQNRLKELDGQRIEQENLQIVSLVRALHMTRDELTAFLKGGNIPAAPTAPSVTRTAATTTYNTREDNEDE
jgi:septal ring factor EnvC (AmiA/AmiB activator)